MHPNIIVKENFELDHKTTLEFFETNPEMIQDVFPHFTSIDKIQAGYNNVYFENRQKFDDTIYRLNNLIPQIEKLSLLISNILETKWKKGSTVTITPSVCPVAARFIETNTFLAPFFHDDDFFLHISAHEMTHFLYFDNLKKMYGYENINTEYPSIDWLLSEIIAPVVVNNDNIQRIIHSKDAFFAPDSYKIDMKKKKKTEELFLKYGMKFYSGAKKIWGN